MDPGRQEELFQRMHKMNPFQNDFFHLFGSKLPMRIVPQRFYKPPLTIAMRNGPPLLEEPIKFELIDSEWLGISVSDLLTDKPTMSPGHANEIVFEGFADTITFRFEVRTSVCEAEACFGSPRRLLLVAWISAVEEANCNEALQQEASTDNEAQVGTGDREERREAHKGVESISLCKNLSLTDLRETVL